MAIRKTIRKPIRASNKDPYDELLKLLEIAEEENIPLPEKKITPWEKIVGALRASETSGIVSDIQQKKGAGEIAKRYLNRIGKGWTGQGLTQEELGVEGYKDILAKEGMSTKGIFGGKGPSPAGIAGFVGDVVLDPLSWLSFGATALGKTAAKQTGKAVLKEMAEKGGSQMVKKMVSEGAEEGAEKAVPLLGKNMLEQAKLGQRSLINVKLPWQQTGKSIVPKAVNEFVYGNVEKGMRKFGETGAGQAVDAVRGMFGNKIPLRQTGTEVAEKAMKSDLAARAARNVEHMIAKQSYQKALEFRKQMVELSKEGGKKADIEAYKGISEEVLDRVEKSKTGQIISTAGLDEGTKQLVLDVKRFRDELHQAWKSVGGKDLADDEIGYWIHTLPYDAKEKLAKQFGYSSRQFNDKVASDIARGYIKFRDTTGVEQVGHIKDLVKRYGFKELDVEGLPKGLYSGGQALNFQKLQKALSKWGVELKYYPKEGIYKAGIKGFYSPRTRRMGIATLNPLKKVGRTSVHEPTHALSGLIGEMLHSFRTRTGRRAGKFKDWDTMIKGLDKAGRAEWEGVIKAYGEDIADMPKHYIGYRRDPDEVIAWANALWSKDPETAEKFFPQISEKLPKLNEELVKLLGFDVNKMGKADAFRHGVDKLFVDSSGNIVKAMNATVKEINESLVKGGGEKLFSSDIPYTAYMMGQRLAKKTAGLEYFNLMESLGKPVKEAPSSWVIPKAKFMQDKGLAFDPDIADLIDATNKAYFTDDAVRGVLAVYDKMLGMWKTSVTAVFPQFHTRNFISNIWQNWLGGVRDPRDYAEAVGILAKVKRGGIESLDDAQRKLYQSYLDNGLSGFGYYGGDIEKNLIGQVKQPGVKGVLQTAKAGPEWLKERGLAVGSKVEDVGKLAHFINKRKAGYSTVDAAESVRKYLFDYTDLSPTEKNIFKRIMPFYTFTRKNLPMELEALISNPSDFANLARTMRVAGYSPYRQEELPSYMREKPSYKIGDKFISGGVLDIPALEPLEMIGDTPGRSVEKTLNKLLGPNIKVPMELALNRNMFQGRPQTEVKNIEPWAGKAVKSLGLEDELGLKENESKSGEIYYTTTKPHLWHVVRNLLSRVYSTTSSFGKISEEDKNMYRSILMLFIGLNPRVTGPAEEAGIRKETIQQLKDLLQGKYYEGSYVGKVKK
jgi:hypothetical protein